MTKRKHPRVGTDPRTGRPIVKYRDSSGRQRTKGGPGLRIGRSTFASGRGPPERYRTWARRFIDAGGSRVRRLQLAG